MLQVIQTLSYLHVFVVAAAGFILGWLWYSVLFGRAWREEMKITPQAMEDCGGRMCPMLATGFFFMLLSTFGLAVLIAAHHSENALKGAELGAFVGAIVVGGQMLNSAIWENRSARLLRINLGYEIVLFALQGALLGCWH
jgi:hypothetical protein